METRRERNRVNAAARRTKRREAGVCVKCGENPPRATGKYCQACLDKSAHYRTKWKEQGLCNRCGRRPQRDDGPACQECYERGLKYYAANKHKHATNRHRRAGLCAICGKRPPMPGTYQGKQRATCEPCNKERNAKNLARRIKGVKYKALERDGFCCQLCGNVKGLIAHHIDGMGDTSGQPNDVIENLITLCRMCHAPITNLRRDNIDRGLACKLIWA